jgi:hypothetical protein
VLCAERRERRLDAFVVVVHAELARHSKTDGGELGGEPGRVGVDDFAAHELGSNRQDGGGHRGVRA